MKTKTIMIIMNSAITRLTLMKTTTLLKGQATLKRQSNTSAIRKDQNAASQRQI